jgi:hypothetical protein
LLGSIHRVHAHKRRRNEVGGWLETLGDSIKTPEKQRGRKQ